MVDRRVWVDYGKRAGVNKVFNEHTRAWADVTARRLVSPLSTSISKALQRPSWLPEVTTMSVFDHTAFQSRKFY